MITLSTDYAKKLRAIRKSEKLTQQQFSKLVGVPLNTIKNYESGQKTARSEIMERVLKVKIFKKYTMWLLHDEVLPEAGQIQPALSHSGSDGMEVGKPTEKMVVGSDVKSSRSVRKTG
ncbi:helix-turn-helix domain-containing protein [Sodalis sp.]|uniref:helix-turn-helix domain-containing protein n=1 Tax=Sodalis sp. (in: enterobacteria) TaxID=1898979 RepID=UPI003873B049